MVVVQSLLDNLCRCICATSIPACGEMPFGGGGSGPAGGGGAHRSSSSQSRGASAERGDAEMTEAAGDAAAMGTQRQDGVRGGGGGGQQHKRERSAPCAMAAGLSTAESGQAASAAAAAASVVAARLRGAGVGGCADSGSMFRPRGGADGADAGAKGAAAHGGGGGDVPGRASSDVSSRSGADDNSSPAKSKQRASPPRPTNSAETAEDREAKEALAEARREAGRQCAGRRRDKARASSSSSRARSRSRSGKRKAGIFRSRNNVATGSPCRARPKDAALADDDAAPVEGDKDPATANATANGTSDDNDDIVGLHSNHHANAGAGRGGSFLCSGPTPGRGSPSRAAGTLGRMMLCFANPIHGSDSDEDYAGGPCGPARDVDSPVVVASSKHRGRKAARTGEHGSASASSSSVRQEPSPPHTQDHRAPVRPKVRTVADDIEDLEAYEEERRRRHLEAEALEALRNGDADAADEMLNAAAGMNDEMTAATGGTNADETITSTLYFDAKLGQVVETAPRPPMPLFQHFKVDVDEDKDDEIRRIVRSGSHKTLSIMQMWKSGVSPKGQGQGQVGQGQGPPVEAAVLRATPTARNVKKALGVKEPVCPPPPPPQSRGRGPPAARQVTPERDPPSASMFDTAPKAPVLHLDDAGGGGGNDDGNGNGGQERDAAATSSGGGSSSSRRRRSRQSPKKQKQHRRSRRAAAAAAAAAVMDDDGGRMDMEVDPVGA